MLSRLKRLFIAEPDHAEREIFRFWNGTEVRGVDPIKAMRALMAHDKFHIENTPKLADAGDQEAVSICIQAMRDVFGVQEWKEVEGVESGLTEDETINLLSDFGEYMGTLKKNGNGQQISPEPLAQQPSERTSSSTSAASASG